jgi:hypothetical protein
LIKHEGSERVGYKPHPLRAFVFTAPPVRIERTHMAPEATALSTELRGQLSDMHDKKK